MVIVRHFSIGQSSSDVWANSMVFRGGNIIQLLPKTGASFPWCQQRDDDTSRWCHHGTCAQRSWRVIQSPPYEPGKTWKHYVQGRICPNSDGYLQALRRAARVVQCLDYHNNFWDNQVWSLTFHIEAWVSSSQPGCCEVRTEESKFCSQFGPEKWVLKKETYSCQMIISCFISLIKYHLTTEH